MTAKLYIDDITTSGYSTVVSPAATTNLIATLASANQPDQPSANSNVKKISLVVQYTGSDSNNANETSENEISVSLPTVTFTATQDGAAVPTTAAPVGP